MDRVIPVWFFLLCLILWGLFTVAFGWAVKSTLAGSNRSGTLGVVAVEIASFPNTVKRAATQLVSYSTGDFRDEWVRVRRDDGIAFDDYVPIAAAADQAVPTLLMKSGPATVTPGWRLLAGAFGIDGDMKNAVLLISPELEIVHRWELSETAMDAMEPQPPHRKFVHGVEILPDGSLIFTFDGSVSLQRIDACGKRQWATGGNFHHSVTLDDRAATVWVLGPHDRISRIATADGSVLQEISMDEVIDRNLEIDILEIRRQHSDDPGRNSRNTEGEWMDDPFHLNDVDPLPTAVAGQFEEFQSGDLLISARSLNLVFVLDPDTLRIKWWRVGAVQRQHDPDWLADGGYLSTITG